MIVFIQKDWQTIKSGLQNKRNLLTFMGTALLLSANWLIYVWAVNPEINFYALRKTPSPFLVHSTSFAKLPWDTHAEVMQSLHRAPPRYIVAMEKMSKFPALQRYVESNYQKEVDPELEELKKIIAFEIYRRKEG